MKKLIIFITALSLAAGITSCTKEETEEPKSKFELLTSKSWVVTSKIVSPSFEFGGFQISDIMSLETDEVKQYSFKYNEDYSIVVSDYLNTPFFETTWSFNDDETEITFADPLIYTYPMVGDIGISTFTLQSISSSKITAMIPTDYEGTTYEVTITFN